MTEAAVQPARGGPWRLLAVAALAVGFGVLVVLTGLYLDRRQIAREAVTDWLRSRGAPARAQFQEIGPGRLVGSLAIGPAAAPDLTVERAEVRYSLAGLLSGKGVQVTSIRLTHPVLRASWRGGRFSAGALDPLITQLRQRPAAPGAPSPRVQVDGGLVRFATDYGALRLSGDALIENGRLVRLAASSAPTRLQDKGFAADLGAGALSAQVTGKRLSIGLQAPFHRLSAGPQMAMDGKLVINATADYPALGRTVVSRGQASARLTAAALRLGAASLRAADVSVVAPDLAWTRAGGERLGGGLRLSGEAHDVSAADLRLATVAGSLQGGFALGGETAVKLSGEADARGAWTGLGAPAAGDSPQIATLKRAMRSFRASAQSIEIAAAGGDVTARLAGPARLLPDTGGEVLLTPAARGWRFAVQGGGLPTIQAAARRFAVSGGAVTADGSVAAALSIGPLEGARIKASGRLRIKGGETSFIGDSCAQLTAARFDLGQNAVAHPSARFCPAGAPLVRIGRAGLVLDGQAEDAAGAVPFLQADIAGGRARVALSDKNGGLAGDIAVQGARLRDAAPAERFRPLDVTGHLGVAHDIWTGEGDIRLPGGARIAHATLRQDGRSGTGAIEITTGTLAFAPGGLQPEAISPVAQALGTGANGEAAFSGAFHWTASGVTSSGELRIGRLDFKSPVGQVEGLSGELRFTSLSPLIAPSPQVLHLRAIDLALPLTDATIRFGMDKTAITGSGQAAGGGGVVRVSEVSIPLAAEQPVRADLRLEGVQLRDLVKASPFGDRVALDAKVSGEIPLTVQGGKIRIARGELHAVAPGRLSIQRAALTSVSAQGSVQAPAQAAGQVASTDTFTDFAYQAMENLAFQKLDAAVATRSDGRLGVIFHIVGYHDPPQHQEITLSLWDLLRKKFLGRKLPLPSGTGVDLTLDTTLNLNDLLKDYTDFEQLRSSPPVQR